MAEAFLLFAQEEIQGSREMNLPDTLARTLAMRSNAAWLDLGRESWSSRVRNLWSAGIFGARVPYRGRTRSIFLYSHDSDQALRRAYSFLSLTGSTPVAILASGSAPESSWLSKLPRRTEVVLEDETYLLAQPRRAGEGIEHLRSWRLRSSLIQRINEIRAEGLATVPFRARRLINHILRRLSLLLGNRFSR